MKEPEEENDDAKLEDFGVQQDGPEPKEFATFRAYGIKEEVIQTLWKLNPKLNWDAIATLLGRYGKGLADDLVSILQVPKSKEQE